MFSRIDKDILHYIPPINVNSDAVAHQLNSQRIKLSQEHLFYFLQFNIRLAVKADDSKNLLELYEGFKSFVSPVSKIQTIKDNDAQSRISFELIKLQTMIFLWDALRAELNTCELILKNFLALEQYINYLKKQHSAGVLSSADYKHCLDKHLILQSSHEEALKSISTGTFETYRKWCWSYQKHMSIVCEFIDVERSYLFLNSQSKTTFNTIISKNVFSKINGCAWENVYDHAESHSPRIHEQIPLFLLRVYKHFESLLMNAETIEGLIEKVEEQSEKIIHSKNIFLQKLEKQRNSNKENELSNYMEEWLILEQENLFDEKDRKNIKSIIKSLIENDSDKLWYLSPSQIEILEKQIKQIKHENIREQYLVTLAECFPQLVLQIINRHIEFNFQNRSLSNKQNQNVTLLDWYQLKPGLMQLEPVSDLQLNIKENLQTYINDLSIAEITIEDDIYCRRQVQYLLCCLYAAASEQIDFNQLFSLPDDPVSIGISRILKDNINPIGKIQALINKLAQIQSKIDHGLILFLSEPGYIKNPIADKAQYKLMQNLPVSAQENFQLYWRYLYNFNYATKVTDEERFGYLYQACALLLQAACNGNQIAESRLLSKNYQIKNYDFVRAVNDEFYARLKQIDRSSPYYDKSQWYIFHYHAYVHESQFYNTIEDRLPEIIHALNVLIACPKQKLINKSDQAVMFAYNENRIAWYFLLQEITGSSLVNSNASASSYPFRLLNSYDLHKLLDQSLNAEAEKKASLINNVLKCYHSFKIKFIRISITKTNGFYKFGVKANDVKKSAGEAISYYDSETENEVLRINYKDLQLKIRVFEPNVRFAIQGNLNLSTLAVFNNEDNFYLDANIYANELNIFGDAKHIDFLGEIKATSKLNWEMQTNVCLSPNTIISANQLNFGLKQLDVHGHIFSNHLSRFEISEILRIGGNVIPASKLLSVGRITSQGRVYINAVTISKVHGDVLANQLKIDSVNNLFFGEQAWIQATEDLEIKAPSLVSTGAKIICKKANARFIIENDITNNNSSWNFNKLSLHASQFKNRGKVEIFDVLDCKAKSVVNYHTGTIITHNALSVCGNAFTNAGKIYFGKTCNISLNHYFMHGFSDYQDLSEEFRNINSNYTRPVFQGGTAVIVTGIYINLISPLSVSTQVLTSIVEINLFSLTIANSRIRSSLFSIDLGIDIPNLPILLNDLTRFVDLARQGQYSKALEMLCTQGAVFKASQFVTWMFKSFIPHLAAPIDLVWSIFGIISRFPQLVAQINTLYKQNTLLELRQLYSLMNTANVLAIQAVYLENRIVGLSHGLSVTDETSAFTFESLEADLAALVLPYSYSYALFRLQGGLHIEPSINHRSAFTLNDFNAQLGLNVSENFYFSYTDNSLAVANNYSQVGQRCVNAGRVIANLVATNINDDEEKGQTQADTINRNSEHYHESSSSSSTSNKFGLNSADAKLNGDDRYSEMSVRTTNKFETSHLHSDRASVEAGQADYTGQNEVKELKSHSTGDTTVDGDLKTSHADVTAGSHAITAGKINILPDAAKPSSVPSFTLRGDAVKSNAKVNNPHGVYATQSTHDTELGNDINSYGVVSQAGGDINNNAKTYTHEVSFQAAHYINDNGITTFMPDRIGHDNYLHEEAGESINRSSESSVSGHGTFQEIAKRGTLGNINVTDLAIAFDHIPDIFGLILKQGVYQRIQYSHGLSLKTLDSVTFRDNQSLSYSLSLNAASIDVEADLHSTGSISLSTSTGIIHLGKIDLSADGYINFDSAGNIIGDSATISAYEIAMQAMRKVINNGGVWAAENYLSIGAHDSVEVNCLSSDVQGEYDTMKSYQPGYLVGGFGEGHAGVGLFIQTDGKFILLGSTVASAGDNSISAAQGVELITLFNRYISYHKESHNWLGRHSETTDYSFQLQPAVIYSKNGSNHIFSSDGSIHSITGQFYAAKDNNLTAKHDIKLTGYVLETREVKDRRNFYFSDKKTDQRDEFAVSTIVDSGGDANICSLENDVDQDNAYVHANHDVNESGDYIRISAPLLKHKFTEETFGFTFSTPFMSFCSSQPLIEDFKGIGQARGPIPFLAQISNVIIDSYNFANIMTNAIHKGAVLSGLAQATGGDAVSVGVTHNKTTITQETVAPNSGVDSGHDMKLIAKESVEATGAANLTAGSSIGIRAKDFKSTGQTRHDTLDSKTENASVGFSTSAKPTFSAGFSGSHSEQTTHQNQLTQAPKVVIETSSIEMKDSNIEGEDIDLEADSVSMESSTGTSYSRQWALSGNTSGDVNAQYSHSQSRVIGEATGLHATHDLEVKASSADLTGAVLISDETGHVTIQRLTTRTVSESNSSQSASIGVNIHDFESNPQPAEARPNISTMPVSFGMADKQSTQQSTIYTRDGSVSIGGMTSGSDPMNTLSPSGHTTQVDKKFEITTKIPTNLPSVVNHPELKNDPITEPDSFSQQREAADSRDEAEEKATYSEDNSASYTSSQEEANKPVKPTQSKPLESEEKSDDSKSADDTYQSTSWVDSRSAYYASKTFASPSPNTVKEATDSTSSSMPKTSKSSQTDNDEKFDNNTSLQNYTSQLTSLTEPTASQIMDFVDDPDKLDLPISRYTFQSGFSKYGEDHKFVWHGSYTQSSSAAPSFADKALAYSKGLTNIFRVSVRMGKDVIIMDTVPLGSPEYKKATAEILSQLKSTKDNLYSTADFLGDVAIMDIMPTDSQIYQDALDRMKSRYTSFKNEGAETFYFQLGNLTFFAGAHLFRGGAALPKKIATGEVAAEDTDAAGIEKQEWTLKDDAFEMSPDDEPVSDINLDLSNIIFGKDPIRRSLSPTFEMQSDEISNNTVEVKEAKEDYTEKGFTPDNRYGFFQTPYRLASDDPPMLRSLSLYETRIWYLDQLANIPNRIDHSLSLEEQVLQGVQFRNEIKLQARGLMRNQEFAKAYGDPPTLKDLARKAYEEEMLGEKFWEMLKEGSQKSNTRINQSAGLDKTTPKPRRPQ